jgi:hypothetical protein
VKSVYGLDYAALAGPKLVMCRSEKSFNKILKRLGAEKLNLTWMNNANGLARTNMVMSTESGVVCIVSLPFSKTLPAEIASLLCHEAVHCWDYYCEYIGEGAKLHEVNAYGIQNIFNALYREYLRTEEKRK